MASEIWDSRGLLPPFDTNGVKIENRSPYKTNIINFIDIFGFNAQRLDILDKFVDYTKIVKESGVQIHKIWIDGSFCEKCETLRKRPPNDIDAVILHTIIDENLLKNNLDLILNKNKVKTEFKTDSYFVLIPPSYANLEDQYAFIEKIVYWSSFWSHTRDNDWKGFIELDNFDGDNYNNAKELIKNKRGEINE